MFPRVVFVGLLLALLGCSGPLAAQVARSVTVSATTLATRASTGDSAGPNLNRARAMLQDEALQFELILVTRDSTGIEGQIYRDLKQRNIRATTGPDEGIDVRDEPCYPECIFVPSDEVNAISVTSWMRVLRHEYRHIIQAQHNPNMARDFRDGDGTFTSYAAFSEACADYGIGVQPDYHAQERIDRLRTVLGKDQQSLIDQACEGDKAAYDELVAEYNRRKTSERAFGELFKPYS